MKKPKVIVLFGYGLNCEEETCFAFEMAGAKVEIIHLNDLISNPKKLDFFQIMAVPGGFSYGDDTGAGNAYANKLKNHLWEKIETFVKKDRLIIGICNGFQILVNLGLLPALEGKYGQREVALLPNRSARYLVRWVDLQSENSSPWLAGIEKLSLPIAHGEGNFFASERILQKLNQQKQVALRYFKGEICEYQSLPANPNGARENIAGITDPTGRVLGLMPHPERAIFFNQLPHWPYLKEKYEREGQKLPENGPGLKLFQNAVKYFN